VRSCADLALFAEIALVGLSASSSIAIMSRSPSQMTETAFE